MFEQLIETGENNQKKNAQDEFCDSCIIFAETSYILHKDSKVKETKNILFLFFFVLCRQVFIVVNVPQGVVVHYFALVQRCNNVNRA